MPEQTNKLKRRKRDRWFLRGDDGSIYGPADMKTLKAWCLEGRIEPDNEISRDQEVWVAAASVSELEMDWYARLEDGSSVGPFPLGIVPGLLENAIIPKSAMIERRATGEIRPATDFVFAIAEEGVQSEFPLIERPEEESSELQEHRVTEAYRQLADTRQMLQNGQAEYAVLEEENQRLREDLVAAQSSCHQYEQMLGEQQRNHEHAQAQHRIEALTAGKYRPVLAVGHRLLIPLTLLLLGVAILLGVKSCRQASAPSISVSEFERSPTSLDTPSAFPAASALDLQPDTTLLPELDTVSPPADEPIDRGWPDITLPRATVTKNARTMRIVFDSGLFSAATRLTTDAQADLTLLAEQLRGRLNGHQLMIQGHTDATPVLTGGSRYVDNFALGMARAEAVKEFLAATGNLPAEAMRTTSAGDSSPPFANDTDTNRMKNRTVIITLLTR